MINDSIDGRILDDLNKPLGQNTANSGEKKPKKPNLSLSVIAVILGLFAVGFIAYDRLYPRNDTAPQLANNSNIDLAKNIPLRNTLTEKELAASNANSNKNIAQTNNSSKIEVVKPTGSMVAPKPRAKPRKLPLLKSQTARFSRLPDPEISQDSANGILPKRGSNGQRAMDIYAREPETSGNFGVARVVIIVAAMGISQSSTQQAISSLPPNVTFAFAPYGNSLNRWMQAARKKGHELLLQVPMEPHGYPQNNPGTQTLRTGVSADKNIANLHWSMGRITNYVGIMNYLGGKFSNDATALTPVFREISDRGLLYVDDGSVSASVTEQLAAQTLLPYAKGHIRIDKIRTKRDIAKNLEKLANEAKRTGLAIGIANAFPETIKLIAQFAKKAPKAGIEITPVSAIVSDPQKK